VYNDDELLPISALQHFVYCPRRAALIFLEREWRDNVFTVEGTYAHSRAHDESQNERRGPKQTLRNMELRSLKWGLSGKSDVVEIDWTVEQNIGRIEIIEYKRGRPKGKRDLPFYVQLCAQVLCLEDMLQHTVVAGAIYYAKAKRRVDVPLDESLRSTTIAAIASLHSLVRSRETPRMNYEKKRCDRCSLMATCLPHAIRPRATAAKYLQSLLSSAFENDESGDSI
jgi:CRISPR-associated exonuclease Cas4